VLTRFAPSGRHFHFVPALPPIPVLARRHAPQSGAILVPLRCPFPSVSVHDVKRNTTPHVGDVVGFLRIHRGGPNEIRTRVWSRSRFRQAYRMGPQPPAGTQAFEFRVEITVSPQGAARTLVIPHVEGAARLGSR